MINNRPVPEELPILPALLTKLVLDFFEDRHREQCKLIVRRNLPAKPALTQLTVSLYPDSVKEGKKRLTMTIEEQPSSKVAHIWRASLSPNYYPSSKPQCEQRDGLEPDCEIRTYFGTATRRVSINSLSPVVKSSLETTSPRDLVDRFPLKNRQRFLSVHLRQISTETRGNERQSTLHRRKTSFSQVVSLQS